MGIAFRPGAAESILGLPVAELTDRHVPLDELWGVRGEELRQRLVATHDHKSVFRVLETELISRLRRPLLIHPAPAFMRLPPGLAHGRLSVSQTSNEIRATVRAIS